MKRLILLLVLSLLVLNVFGQQTVKLSDKGSYFDVDLVGNQLIIKFSLDEILLNKVNIDGKEFIQLFGTNLKKTFGRGEPMLPAATSLLQVPIFKGYEIKVIRQKSKDIYLEDKLFPAQPSWRKSEKPKFVFDKEAYEQEIYPSKLVDFEYVGIQRSAPLAFLKLTPFEYYPKKNILRVYYELEIRIQLKNVDWERTNDLQRFSSVVFPVDKYTMTHLPRVKEFKTQLPIKLIVVATEEFIPVLKPFIELKKMQGIEVEVLNATELGVDTSAIRNWLKDYYYNSTRPQDFVLFIGDVEIIPSYPQRTIDQHVTDLYYCEYTGDYLPEVLWGRLPADNPEELKNMIDKIVNYETGNLKFDTTKVLLIAGNDETYEDNYGNGQIYYAENYYFDFVALMVDKYKIYALYQDPPANVNYTELVNDYMNDGVLFANYTAHCSPSGWADPSFSVASLSNMTNYGKYGLWIGNCCQSNKYDEQDAFSEEALKLPNSGAVAYIGGSDYTYWDEDYWWAVGYSSTISAQPSVDQTGIGMYDAAFHWYYNMGTNYDNWSLFAAQFIYAGNMAVEQSTSNLKHYYWEIYQLMGDPSMMPFFYFDSLKLSFNNIYKGTNSITITTDTFSYITVLQNNYPIAYATNLNDSTITITTNSVIYSDTIELYIWGQNKLPLYLQIPTKDTTIPVIKISTDKDLIPALVTDTLVFIFTFDMPLTAQTDTLYNFTVNFSAPDSNLSFAIPSANLGNLIENKILALIQPLTITKALDSTQVPIKYSISYTYNGKTYLQDYLTYLIAVKPKLELRNIKFDTTVVNDILQPNTNVNLTFDIVNNSDFNVNDIKVKIKFTPALAQTADSVIVIPLLADSAIANISVNINVDNFTGAYPGVLEVELYIGDYKFSNYSYQIYFGMPDKIVLGDDLKDVFYPFYNYYQNGITQILLKYDEIKFINQIASIGFEYSNSNPNFNFNNLTIIFTDTTLNQIDDYIPIDNPDTVFYQQTYRFPTGIVTHYLNVKLWQIKPNKNLLITISFQNDDWTYDYITNFGSSTDFQSVYYKFYDSPTYIQQGVSNYRPNIILANYNAYLNEESGDYELFVYPNPTNGVIYLSTSEQNFELKVYDITGKLLFKAKNKKVIDLSALPSGYYTIVYMSSDRTLTAKVLKY